MRVLSTSSIVHLNDEFPAGERWMGEVVSHAIVDGEVHYVVRVSDIEVRTYNLKSNLQIVHSESVICIG